MNDYVPTAKLRWIRRLKDSGGKLPDREYTLEQWFAPDVPKYMIDPTVGRVARHRSRGGRMSADRLLAGIITAGMLFGVCVWAVCA